MHLANAYVWPSPARQLSPRLAALFLLLAKEVWGWPLWRLVAIAVVIGGLEMIYFAANVIGIPSGIAAAYRGDASARDDDGRDGSAEVARRRAVLEGPPGRLHRRDHRLGIPRAWRLAYLHLIARPCRSHWKENVDYNQVLHETIVIAGIVTRAGSHIRMIDRAQRPWLGRRRHRTSSTTSV